MASTVVGDFDSLRFEIDDEEHEVIRGAFWLPQKGRSFLTGSSKLWSVRRAIPLEGLLRHGP